MQVLKYRIESLNVYLFENFLAVFGDSSSAARVNTNTTIPFSINGNQIGDILARALRNNETATCQPTEAGTTSQKTLNGRDQQGMKVAGDIVDLVVTLTKLQNVSVINMLKETVNSASSDLDSLLDKIKVLQTLR